jgi:SAM-dependent MidA family methyltransferase|tara:strand:- start:275 stop:436 length:162 start_codon:yes stop_codon:yes gene_type:complete
MNPIDVNRIANALERIATVLETRVHINIDHGHIENIDHATIDNGDINTHPKTF